MLTKKPEGPGNQAGAIHTWQCSVCEHVCVGMNPPDKCPSCNKVLHKPEILEIFCNSMGIFPVRRLKTFEEIHPSWHHLIKDEHKKFLGKKVHTQMTMGPNWVYVRECGPNRVFNLAWFKKYDEEMDQDS